MKRKSSASPVCYAEDKGIDPVYMWAQPKRKGKTMPKRSVRKAKVGSAKR